MYTLSTVREQIGKLEVTVKGVRVYDLKNQSLLMIKKNIMEHNGCKELTGIKECYSELYSIFSILHWIIQLCEN